MAENTNHETGGSFVNEDVITEMCANTKMILIASSGPANTYDGQIWNDTSEDPPVTKVRDETNTAWMTRRKSTYESAAGGNLTYPDTPDDFPVVNGSIVIKRNTDLSASFIYVRADESWYGATTA